MCKPATGSLSWLCDQRGLTTVEYTILLTLIVVLCVGTWQTLGQQIEKYISGANTKITSQLGEPGNPPKGD